MKFLKGLKAVLGLFLFVFVLLSFSSPAQAGFSTDLGAITGSIKWGTETVNPRWGTVFISAMGNTTNFTAFVSQMTGTTDFVLPPDTYTVTGKVSYPRGLMITGPLEIPVGTQTVTVTGGQTTNVDFDASTVSGLVKGNLTVNGVPTSGRVQFCGSLETDPCPTNIMEQDGIPNAWFNATGFSLPIPAGNYRVQVTTEQGLLVGRVPVSIALGQMIADSSLQFSQDFGAISSSIKWGTEGILPTWGITSIGVVGNTTNFTASVPQMSGNTGFILPPDTYTVTAKTTLQQGLMMPLEILVGTQTVTVTGGQTATVDFDASTVSGLVKGNLTVNATPTPGYIQFCGPLETDPCPTNIWQQDGIPYAWFFAGGFSLPIPAGNYRVQVTTEQGLLVGRVPITVTVGQITGGTSLQFSYNLGAISSTIKWGTESILPTWGITSIGVVGNTTNFTASVPQMSGNTGFILPPDTYTVTGKAILQRGLTVMPLEIPVGSQTVNVTGGQTTNVDFDASTVSGLVKGNLTVNGVPTSGLIQFCGPLETDPCPTNIWQQDGIPYAWFFAGGFSLPIPAGNYRVQVTTEQGLLVGRVPVNIAVGQMIDLGASVKNVPAGQNVVVSLPAVEVTFPEVQTAGMVTLTTTNNPQGGTPPSQYEFIGTYYELVTTAAYSAPVTVKMFYNDADVTGIESNLKLFHWDGTAWQDITTNVDTVNNVITGISPTLSPFAIGEPLNSPPTVDAGGPYQVDEGGAVQISASGSDPENKPLTYAWDLDNNGSFETAGQTATFSAASLDGPSTKTVVVQVTDEGGLTATNQATINIVNVAPQVGEISLPADPQQANNPINFSASFTDAGTADTHTAVWDWGDGSISAAAVNETGGSGTAGGSHIYSSAGVYSAKLTVTDDDGASKEKVSQFVVIYDPSAGFVTGGGQQDNSSGKTQLGFTIKYLPGDSTPSGQIKFMSKDNNLNFTGSDYQWLVVTSPKAVFKGTGKVNGEGNYTFIVDIIDGQTDYFRMKITDNSNGNVIYDNQPGAEDTVDPTVPLITGSIVIH